MKNGNGYPATEPETLRAIPRACADEAEAVAFLEQLRWNGKPQCPRCQSYDVYTMQSREGGREKHYRLRCRECKRQFSVRTDTPMERTNIPMRIWLTALWMQVTSKKGVPALQVARMTGLSYKWALFLCHRIRHAVSEPDVPTRKLIGHLESDEAYIGGKPRKGNWAKRHGPIKPKVPVIAVLERGGDIRAQVVPDATVTGATVSAFLTKHADMRSRLITDDSMLYNRVGHRFEGRHHSVNHGYFECSRKVGGDRPFTVHTNTVEGFWGLLKKRIGATHHIVSVLPRYVAEACFHWNTRRYSDGDRLRMAVIRGEGKRLNYQGPSAA